MTDCGRAGTDDGCFGCDACQRALEAALMAMGIEPTVVGDGNEAWIIPPHILGEYQGGTT